MISLEKHTRGTLLPVRAHAGARQNGIVGEHDGMLRVDVTAAPDKGKANKAIVAILSEALAVPKSAIELVSGATSPRKKFLVEGMSVDAVQTLLDRCVEE
jgi:hypothetical protein